MPHARAEMYKRGEDVQRGEGGGGVRRGKKHRRPPRQRRESAPPLASQHLVNIRGPSACGVVEGRR